MTIENSAESAATVERQQSTAVGQQLIEESVGRGRAEGLQLTGEGGLSPQGATPSSS